MQMNDCMYVLLYPPFNPHDSHMHSQPIVINPCHAHSHTRSQAQITLLEMLKISFFLFENKKQPGKKFQWFCTRNLHVDHVGIVHRMFTAAEQWTNKYGQHIKINTCK